jgi:hypothetical protein
MAMYYVQKTLVQVLQVEASDPESAEEVARNTDEPTWFTESIDTERDFCVLNTSSNIG